MSNPIHYNPYTETCEINEKCVIITQTEYSDLCYKAMKYTPHMKWKRLFIADYIKDGKYVIKDEDKLVQCSHCNEKQKYPSNYCPNCGYKAANYE